MAYDKLAEPTIAGALQRIKWERHYIDTETYLFPKDRQEIRQQLNNVFFKAMEDRIDVLTSANENDAEALATALTLRVLRQDCDNNYGRKTFAHIQRQIKRDATLLAPTSTGEGDGI